MCLLTRLGGRERYRRHGVTRVRRPGRLRPTSAPGPSPSREQSRTLKNRLKWGVLKRVSQQEPDETSPTKLTADEMPPSLRGGSRRRPTKQTPRPPTPKPGPAATLRPRRGRCGVRVSNGWRKWMRTPCSGSERCTASNRARSEPRLWAQRRHRPPPARHQVRSDQGPLHLRVHASSPKNRLHPPTKPIEPRVIARSLAVCMRRSNPAPQQGSAAPRNRPSPSPCPTGSRLPASG